MFGRTPNAAFGAAVILTNFIAFDCIIDNFILLVCLTIQKSILNLKIV